MAKIIKMDGRNDKGEFEKKRIRDKEVNKSLVSNLCTASSNRISEEILGAIDFRGAHQRLLELHHAIRKYSPVDLNFLKLSSEVVYREWMDGEIVQRRVFFLPIIYGCAWKRTSGGCINCGMARGVGVRLPSALAIKAIVDKTTTLIVNQESPEWVCIYNEGSFLNAAELSQPAQMFLLEMVAEVPSVRRITIESRPEFITEKVLEKLSNIATSHRVEIEIGIGLEVRDDFIRSHCINKGFTWKIFERVVGTALKFQGLRSLAYILLKPPFLSEKESISESIKTIQECFKIGVDAVSLEIMSIHEWTLVEYLWLRGFYELPWLWSAIEIVLRTGRLGEVRIGGEPETYFPKSLTSSHNCESCTEKVWKAIRRYNESRDLSCLSECSCECRGKWLRIIKECRDSDEEENEENEEKLEQRIRQRMTTLIQSPLSLEDYLGNKILLGGKNHEGHQFSNI